MNCSNDNTMEVIEVFFSFELYLDNILMVLSLFGALTNVINIIVYCKGGLNDSVTITFISLAIWDIGNCLTTFMIMTCYQIEIYFPVATISFIDLMYVYFVYTRRFMTIMSASVTLYLSIERCLCVLIPLKVKGLFTNSRSFFINIGIVVFAVSWGCTSWATQGLHWGFDQKFNRTRLIRWVSENRKSVMVTGEIFSGIFITTVAQISITVNSVLMIWAVNLMTQFRRTATEIHYRSTSLLKVRNTITRKEARMTKAVILIDIAYFMCNFPLFIYSIARLIIHDFETTFPDIYKLLVALILLLGVINSNASFVIYYSVSTKYKDAFQAVMCKFNHIKLINDN